jgi:hypothetical protein
LLESWGREDLLPRFIMLEQYPNYPYSSLLIDEEDEQDNTKTQPKASDTSPNSKKRKTGSSHDVGDAKYLSAGFLEDYMHDFDYNLGLEDSHSQTDIQQATTSNDTQQPAQQLLTIDFPPPDVDAFQGAHPTTGGKRLPPQDVDASQGAHPTTGGKRLPPQDVDASQEAAEPR